MRRRPRTFECLVRRARSIHLAPVDGAEIVARLLAGDLRIRVGGVAHARTNPRDAGCEIGGEKQTAECEVSRRARGNVAAFLRLREHRIDDGGMSGAHHADSSFAERSVNPCGHGG